MPLTMPSTAWSSGASSKMMFAALPPSSSVSFLPLPAIDFWIALPTSVEPVKATLSTPGCLTSSAPARPSPVTMLTTPGGSSAWRRTSQKRSAVRGVVSAGFRTTVFPAASAGAIFQESMRSGKFQGMTWPATPTGLGLLLGKAYSKAEGTGERSWRRSTSAIEPHIVERPRLEALQQVLHRGDALAKSGRRTEAVHVFDRRPGAEAHEEIGRLAVAQQRRLARDAQLSRGAMG